MRMEKETLIFHKDGGLKIITMIPIDELKMLLTGCHYQNHQRTVTIMSKMYPSKVINSCLQCPEYISYYEDYNYCTDWCNKSDKEIYDANKIQEWCQLPDEKTNTTMRWVPVSERLPEDGTYVLGWHYGCSNGYCGVYKYQSLGRQFKAGISSPPFPVTHWMPLPQPPKDGDNK